MRHSAHARESGGSSLGPAGVAWGSIVSGIYCPGRENLGTPILFHDHRWNKMRERWRPEPRIRWRRRLTRWWLGSTRTATRGRHIRLGRRRPVPVPACVSGAAVAATLIDHRHGGHRYHADQPLAMRVLRRGDRVHQHRDHGREEPQPSQHIQLRDRADGSRPRAVKSELLYTVRSGDVHSRAAAAFHGADG